MTNINFDVKTSFPKSYEKLKKWIASILGDQVDDNMMELIVASNPRCLFDFFDGESIMILISPPAEATDRWTYWNTTSPHSLTASSRGEAEVAAFEDAFKAMEERL